ncbi:MAG: glycosyltransferase family 87 protein [Pseudomonadota bacterium]
MDSPSSRRLTFAAQCLLVAWLVFLVVGHVSVWRQGADFVSFWSAGRFVIEGRAAEAYDAVRLVDWQHAHGFDGAYPYLAPPPFLLMAAPLGLLTYPVALAVWIAAGYAAHAMSLRWAPRAVYWPAVAFPGALLAAMAGQSSLFLSALMCAAVGALPGRQALSGALIGLMVLKPQLALLTPVALAAAGAWRAFLVAGLVAAGSVALSVAILGEAPMSAFLASSEYLNGLYARPELLPKIKSVYGALTLAGAPAALALTGQAIAFVFAAYVVWRVWRRSGDTLTRGAVLAAATPLAPPYIQLYDLVFLALPTAWLIHEGLRRPFGRLGWALTGLAFFLPIAALAAPLTWPVAPVWSLALSLAVLWLAERHAVGAVATGEV